MQKILNNQKGYIALVSMLLLMMVSLVVGTILIYISISESHFALSDNFTSETFYISEACAELALLGLRLNPSYSGLSLDVGTGSCSASISGSGLARNIYASGYNGDFIRELQVQARVDIPYILTYIYWHELP